MNKERDLQSLFDEIDSFRNNPLPYLATPGLEERDYDFYKRYRGKELDGTTYFYLKTEEDTLINSLMRYEETPYSLKGSGLSIDTTQIGKLSIHTDTDIPPLCTNKDREVTPTFLTFSYITNPVVEPLDIFLPFPIRCMLTLGLYTDSESHDEFSRLQETRPDLLKFQTRYMISSNESDRRLYKVATIPYAFSDDRMDLLPAKIGGRYVFSQVTKNDSKIALQYLDVLNERLEQEGK